MEKLVRLQSITMVSLILCVAFHTRLISQSRDHDEVFPEYEILIYDRKLNGRHHNTMEKDRKSNKSDTHVSKHRKARHYRTYSYTKCVRLPDL